MPTRRREKRIDTTRSTPRLVSPRRTRLARLASVRLSPDHRLCITLVAAAAAPARRLPAAGRRRRADLLGAWPRSMRPISRQATCGVIIAFDRTLEHPSLAKLLYALPCSSPSRPDFDVSLHLRALALGALWRGRRCFCWRLLNPLAGFALAIHTMTIKYTSQVYLEAVPGFFAIAAMLAFERYRAAHRRRTRGGARHAPRHCPLR